jgi:hypothetical protein
VRIESSVTSITWIPSEAIEGMPKLPFELGLTHYDDPPPEVIEDLNALRDSDSFREANELRAWIEVRGGKIVDYAYRGRGMIGVTRVKLGPKTIAFPAVKYPLIQAEPQVTDQWVRFEQTAGGRMGLPAPRRVRGKPFFQFASASAWTTLSLIIYADGTSKHALEGASPFPRHWIYDKDGRLVEKSGIVDFETWWRESHGRNTPWGDEDSPALVTTVESELERALSSAIMHADAKLARRRLEAGETLVEQGEEGLEVFLLLDGLIDVEVDGETVAQVGPGAVLGERAIVEFTPRTATLRAATPARVVVAPGEAVDPAALERLAASRRGED